MGARGHAAVTGHSGTWTWGQVQQGTRDEGTWGQGSLGLGAWAA